MLAGKNGVSIKDLWLAVLHKHKIAAANDA